MLIIADHRLPKEAQEKLHSMGELFLLKTTGIVYDSISGHPDIFICQTPSNVIVAPNAPKELLEFLTHHNQSFEIGDTNLAPQYPQTAAYNAFVDESIVVHKLQITDPTIIRATCAHLHINVEQAYTRCNLIKIKDLFITSDKGIEKALKAHCKEVFFVCPSTITLLGHKHGFIGGCSGIWQSKWVVAGSLRHLPQGDALNEELIKRGIDCVELYDGCLFDGGSILFLP
ncbi:MAG TPA: hypothetical protein DCM62_07425 [Bacteroidales bacterium]|nr:hypothetical protein [Bacteroidales bacterium]